MSKAGRQERHVARQPAWQWESSHGWSSLAANIQQSQARWGGIPSACWAFMAVQRAALLPHQPVLIIADGLKSQELLQQDAETWLQWAGTRDEKPSTARRPLFYPAWEHLPHEDKLPHADIITERLNTLCQLLSWRVSESEPTSLAPVMVLSLIHI